MRNFHWIVPHGKMSRWTMERGPIKLWAILMTIKKQYLSISLPSYPREIGQIDIDGLLDGTEKFVKYRIANFHLIISTYSAKAAVFVQWVVPVQRMSPSMVMDWCCFSYGLRSSRCLFVLWCDHFPLHCCCSRVLAATRPNVDASWHYLTAIKLDWFCYW